MGCQRRPDDGTPDGIVVLFFEHWECPNVSPQHVECRDADSAFLGERVIFIHNPSAPPNHWDMTHVDIADATASPAVTRVRWGVGALYDPPYIYIYGRPTDNDPTTRGELETESIKVASARVDTITDVNRWRFLVPDGNGWITWHDGPPDSVRDLQTVAHSAGNIFSVDKIEHGGKSAYVMVHPLFGAHGVLRTSDSPLLWPDFGTPFADPETQQAFGPQSRIGWDGNVAPAGPAVTIGNVMAVEPDYAAQGAAARDFRAHPELRGGSTVPSTDLLISYHLESEDQNYGASIGRNRFLRWALSRTYPWCADGADLSACEYCGNGRREGYEDCDPTAPAAQRFDPGRFPAAGSTLRCSDIDIYGVYGPNADTPVACNSYCMIDNTVCLPDLECTRDAQCANGQVCKCDTPITCSCTEEGWTEWLDRDQPSNTGDYEPIRLHAHEGNSCTTPTAVACRRKSDQLHAAFTGEKIRCDTEYGFACRRADQPDNQCFDYEVRFYCGAP